MLIQFSMFPVGSSESASAEVSKIIDLIDKSGLPYKTSAMSTVIEGEWDEIMPLIDECRLKLGGKVASIEDKLKRKIKS